MKNIFQNFRKNSTAIHLIAVSLVICMGLADASLYISYALAQKEAGDDVRVVTEDHEMDVAMADGYYDGNNSDSESADQNTVVLSQGKHLFCILEIVPTEGKGVIGYTIRGCEPFSKKDFSPIKPIRKGEDILASEEDIREAYMDAVLNATPGVKDANMINNCSDLVKDIIQNMSTKLKEGGSTEAFTIASNGEKHNGYYKWVGHNLGVFAEGEETNVDGEKDKKMYSRFYDYSESRNYDYIFVYSEASSTNPKDINVKNHRRIKYQNNDRFLKDMLGIPASDVATWRTKNTVQVLTRTPMSVTLEDIEKADLITVNNGNKMDYYNTALKIYNFTHGETNLEKNKDVVYSEDVDFSNFIGSDGNSYYGFEKVARIYERVAVREDAAFIVSKNSFTDAKFDTNMNKLMCMLFYVVTKADSTPGVGRQFFMDFMKRYTSDPGRYPAGPAGEAGQTYWDLRQKDSRYVAPTLRNNSTNYMHSHMANVETHPGHPMTTDLSKVITRGVYENGILTGYRDDSDVYRRTIRRGSGNNKAGDKYFEDAGYHIKDDDHKNGYYYSEQKTDWGDQLISSSQAAAHPWCLNGYESMSNATDYTYIDDDGTLVRDDKYSGDKGFWFKCDQDDGGDWFAFKKIVWDKKSWTTWPWSGGDNAAFAEWLLKKGTTSTRDGGEQGNMHLWYDYYDENFAPYSYRTLDSVSANSGYKNAKVIGENDSLKYDYMYDALDKRTVKREKTDPEHIVTNRKDYYISMNILNGDGLNETNPLAKNKTLYFNQYEKDDITEYETANNKAKIPINIRVRSTCKIKDITVSDNNGVIATYTFESEVAGKEKLTGTGGRGLVLNRLPGSVNDEGLPIKSDGSYDITPLGEPKYTFEGTIYDVMSSRYLSRRNTTISVTMRAYVPGGELKPITDTITIVKRDFFMLD